MDPERHVYVVTSNRVVPKSISDDIAGGTFATRTYHTGNDFLSEVDSLAPGCLLLDTELHDTCAIELLRYLNRVRLKQFSTIVLVAANDLKSAVVAMRQGAVDFLEKPLASGSVIGALNWAFTHLDLNLEAALERHRSIELVATLSPREHDVFLGLIAGKPNKRLAYDLGLSVRTVEMHRWRMMERLGVQSFSEAIWIAFCAGLRTSPNVEGAE